MIKVFNSNLLAGLYLAWMFLVVIGIKIFWSYIWKRKEIKEVKDAYLYEFAFPKAVFVSAFFPILLTVPSLYFLITSKLTEETVYVLAINIISVWIFFTAGLLRKMSSPHFTKCLMLIGAEILLGLYIFIW